jgi:hypothetical protein
VTLAITDSWDVRGVTGPAYKVGPRCANPTCNRFAEHAHHLVRRSQLGGEFNWVEIEGVVWQNKSGLCAPCHDDITGKIGGHRAAIRFEDAVFEWCLVSYDDQGELIFLRVGDLDPQPMDLTEFEAHVETEPSEACPTCGSVRRRKAPRQPGQRRRTWIVKVPETEAEDGAYVLDTLVDDLAVLLGVEPNASGRYYVIVPVLAYAQMNRQTFIDSIAGKGG